MKVPQDFPKTHSGRGVRRILTSQLGVISFGKVFSPRYFECRRRMAWWLPAAQTDNRVPRLCRFAWCEAISSPIPKCRLISKSMVFVDARSPAIDTFASYRTSYFEFNFTARQFEYFSLDSRLPQMMNERSAVIAPSTTSGGGVTLKGERFVAPTWGMATNVPFRYRLTVGDVKGDRQTVQLFLTPESGKDRKEFLAFEYLYTRMP
jgi:hypothetical protein